MDNIEQLDKKLSLTLGRTNGIHMLLVTMASALPPDIAATWAQELAKAIEIAEADLLALPVSDIAIEETSRVVRGCLFVLQKAAERTR